MSSKHEADDPRASADALAPDLAATWAASGELRRDWRDNVPDDKAGGVALLTMGLGAWGVVSGIALFMLLHESQARSSLWVVLLALGVAALVALLTEYLRERIEHGKAHDLLTKLPVTVLTLGLFELFITAWHVASEMGREFFIEAGALILGPELAGRLNAPWAAVALAVLWVVEGAVLALVLALRLLKEPGAAPPENVLSWKLLAQALRSAGRSALGGAIAGAVAGAIGLVLTVVAIRAAAAVSLMVTEPEQWLALVRRAPAAVGASGWMLRMLFLPAQLLTELWMWGAWGPLLTIAAIAFLVWICKKEDTWWPLAASIGGLFLVILAPLVGSVSTVLWMAFLAGVVWLVPGFCLGASVPLLRGPASSPRVWSLAAFAAAVALMVVSFVWHRGHFSPPFIGLAAIAGIAAFIFWLGGDLKTYWPLAALVLSSYVALFTVAQQATFSGILELLSKVSATPTAPGEEPGVLDELHSLKYFQSSELLNLRPTIPRLQDSDPIYKMSDEMRSLAGNRPRVSVTPPLVRATEEAQAEYEGVEQKLEAQVHVADEERRDLARRKDAIEKRREALAKTLDDYLNGKPSRTGPPDEWPDRKARVVLQKLYFLQHEVEARQKELLSPVESTHGTLSTAELFELSVTGSLAFWVTVGLLVGWSTRQHEPVLAPVTPGTSDDRRTCFWATGPMQKYHDEIHGLMPANDRELFERLALEMLGGDAWAHHDELRKACLDFDVEKLAVANPKAIAMAVERVIPNGRDPGLQLASLAMKYREAMKKVAGPEGRGVLEDWSRKAQLDPESLVRALRRDLGLPRRVAVGNLLLGTGMVAGGHFRGCWKSPEEPTKS